MNLNQHHIMTLYAKQRYQRISQSNQKKIQEWIASFHIESKYVTIVGKDHFGLNSELVIILQGI